MDKEKGRDVQNYMGTKEAAERWGVLQTTVSKWCREKKIPGAEQDGKGSPWRIPYNTKRPARWNVNYK